MRQLILASIFGLFFSLTPAHGAAPDSYHFIQAIPIGGAGGWDYLTIDPSARRLFMSQATRIVVIDIEKNKIIGEITDTPGVHGIAISGELNRAFSSNGKENKVSIIDLATRKTIAKVSTGENPDAIIYIPQSHEVYAFNGRTKSATVIMARSGDVAATIALAGKPEFAAVDTTSQRVFVNIEDKSVVEVIDTKSHQIAATWPLAPCETPTGMAIDTRNQRLFIGCENELMVMMDSATGKILSTVPIGKGVDAIAYDQGTKFVFSSNGEGTVTIAQEATPGKLTVSQTLKTQKGARTLALDPQTHRIYLPAADFELPTSGEGKRPGIIPGTLKILVYGPSM